jgi:hypothetical protein
VSTASDGDFVVVWQTYASSGTDASSLSIQGQRYDSNGLPQGGEFQVNTYTTGYQKFPSVFSASNGDFIVVWQSEGSSSTDTSEESIQGQRYASDGSPQGGEFQINTDTTGAQKLPSVSSASNGDFVVVWAAYSSGSNQHSIQGQRYSVTSPNLVPSLSPTGLLGLATLFAFGSVFALRRRGGNRSLT